MEKTNRQLAIEWWNNLTPKVKDMLASKYKPDWTTDMVSRSSSTIEKMYDDFTVYVNHIVV